MRTVEKVIQDALAPHSRWHCSARGGGALAGGRGLGGAGYWGRTWEAMGRAQRYQGNDYEGCPHCLI